MMNSTSRIARISPSEKTTGDIDSLVLVHARACEVFGITEHSPEDTSGNLTVGLRA